jgi:hypothetical protein
MGLFGSITGTLSGGRWADPADLFGKRAKQNQDDINAINQSAADASMKELQDSYDKIKVLYQPLEDAGSQGLAQLNSAGFTPSQTYKDALATGERDLGRQLRAMGRYRSTFGARKMGDFYNRSAQEEVDRQYAPTLSLIQTGSGAVNAITGAGTTFGGATDRTLANLGQGLANSATLYGQQRQSSMNNLSNMLGGAAQYFNAK